MQGHFYFTQQQLSGFAVAFPLDSICNGDWLWLSHVVPHHRNPACGNRQELGQAKAVAYCPHPQRHQEGLAAPTQELPPTARQGEHLSHGTSQKINGSTKITRALGSTPTKIVCLAKSSLFHVFLSWKYIKHTLSIH